MIFCSITVMLEFSLLFARMGLFFVRFGLQQSIRQSISKLNFMYPIIDFRNGRYQGQTKNQLPDGVGILVDKNFLFCVAEWVAGQIKGSALIFYPDGLVFSGHIAFKKPDQLCTYELPTDHVRLISFEKPRKGRQVSKITAVMPLLKIILQIDNTNQMEARVLQEYEYSVKNENENITCISKILNLDRNGHDALMKQRNCIEFLQEYFAFRYEEIFQFMINENKGRKDYFFGLRGEGLGIKIEPVQELGVSFKQTGRVYHIRAVGHFTKENQMKDIGFKTLDNAMKGVIYEEGIYSLPNTVIKYEAGKRPVNCVMTFYNYIKRSMYYRDKVIDTDYIYDAERFVLGFNQNLRKAQTERLAQYTIQNPNNTGKNLMYIEEKRIQKERQRELFLKQRENVIDTPNPYNPNVMRYTNPNYNLQTTKDQILRSVSKKRSAGNTISQVDYGNVEYVDPNYVKVDREQKQPRNHEIFQEKPRYENPRYRYNPDYNDNFENSYTPKKYYPSRVGNYLSGNRDLPERRYNPDIGKYERPVGQYTTPPKKTNYDTVGDDYLQQTRPKPRYDYLFEGDRENRYDDSYSYPRRDRSTTPDRNLRRQTMQSNRFH